MHRRMAAFRLVRIRAVDAIGAYQARDILEALLAEINKLCSDFAPDLTIDVLGKTDSSGLGDAFEASGDIDAVAAQHHLHPLQRN